MKNKILFLGVFAFAFFLLANDAAAECKLGGNEVPCDDSSFVFWGIVLIGFSIFLAFAAIYVSFFKEKTLRSTAEFDKDLIATYNELNVKYDRKKFGITKKIDKFFHTNFLESVSYMFPPAVGTYKGRELEIAPSYYPYFISDVSVNFIANAADDILLRQLNPSVLVKSGINKASYDYMVIRMKMKADIGMPSVLICPRTIWNKIGMLLSFRVGIAKTDYKDFDEKYLMTIRNQKWFLNCLNKEIMDSMIGLELPKYRGAIFQFSKNHCTFSILPRTIGKEKIMRIIDILEKIAKNIENEFTASKKASKHGKGLNF